MPEIGLSAWRLSVETRSARCGVWFTGQPRPIRTGDSMRCGTRSTAKTPRGAPRVAVRRNNGAPDIGRTTFADAGEYGVSRLLNELASDLRLGPLSGAHPG